MQLQSGNACAGSEQAAVVKGIVLCWIWRWVLVAAMVCFRQRPTAPKHLTFLKGLAKGSLPLPAFSEAVFYRLGVGSVQLTQKQSPRNEARE